ncbi:hypothetical protein NIES2100_14570 [Calothrix sp. NIES-2100]|uniref:hypothetical protein n=1 Tax=Calothrix sp. NIES-2100 TaxID=1954172 RepID=UPI000B619455|nr:hypothetical protein NIES2100_14570 [Calothrix sp. NIES-2100]
MNLEAETQDAIGLTSNQLEPEVTETQPEPQVTIYDFARLMDWSDQPANSQPST